jgi:hypothetical protein
VRWTQGYHGTRAEDSVVDGDCGNLPKKRFKNAGSGTVEGGDSYQGTPSGMPQKPSPMPALADAPKQTSALST